MSEDRIRLLMGDFTKNAGLGASPASYPGKQALERMNGIWRGRFADRSALQDGTGRICILKLLSDTLRPTTWQRLLDAIEDMQAVLKQENWQADKKVKEKLKFINDKLLSNSYKNGFENIRNNRIRRFTRN